MAKRKEGNLPFIIAEIEECFKKEGENVDREKSIEFDPFEKFGYEETQINGIVAGCDIKEGSLY